MHCHDVFAAAIVSAAFVGGVGPAGALIRPNSLTHSALTHNAINHNVLTRNAFQATGSALDEMNGVAVEAVSPTQTATLPQQEQVVAIISPR